MFHETKNHIALDYASYKEALDDAQFYSRVFIEAAWNNVSSQKIFENTGQNYKNLLDNWNSQWTQNQLDLVKEQMNNFYDEFANFNGIYSLFLFCSILDGFVIGSFTDNYIFCDLVTLGKKEEVKDTIEKVKGLYTLRLNFMKKLYQYQSPTQLFLIQIYRHAILN
jgi:hypothetical protein